MKNRLLSTLLVLCMVLVWMSGAALAGEFSDVSAIEWYADAVTWAVGKGITTGTGNAQFSPQKRCTKAEILTFLWRYEYCPEPETANPFTDVTPDNYYYKAALWAYEKGLVAGTVFEATIPCTRSMTVMYLWKLSGSPFASITGTISDVPVTADYAQAVAWALEKGITHGIRETTFGPDYTCTRAEIVTFLRRFDIAKQETAISTPSDMPQTPDTVQVPETVEPQPLTIGTSISKSSSIVGSMYSIKFSLSANVTGGTGEYSYKFEVLQNGNITESTAWTNNNGISGTLSGNGTCVVEISVKDSNGETASTTVDLLQSSSFGW